MRYLTLETPPGQWWVILTLPTEVDSVGFQARGLGLEVRDCFSVQTPKRPIMALLLRAPLDTSITDQIVRNGLGVLDIDSGRISTTDSLDGGDTSSGKRSELYGDRPWMHDDAVLATRRLEAMDKVKRAESMGRFPSNFLLVHGPSCKKVGTIKIGSGPEGGYTYEDTTYNVKGFVPSCKPQSASNRGTETIPKWECQADCPVSILDSQSVAMGMHGAGHVRDGSDAVVADTYKANAYELGPNRNMARYGDEGGASRFFYQATTMDGVTDYLAKLARTHKDK